MAVNQRRVRRVKKFCLVMTFMTLVTTTPFGQRPMTAALVKQAQAAQSAVQIPHINKWEIFRELCAAKSAYGVGDRELTVLNALLSFHQDATLSDNANLIVFPSNRSLAERAHGMAESTLRRHLARLVNAGLIRRHDSPNGKRYAARGADGEISRAFGFDLRPLLEQGRAITRAAREARAAAERLKRLREEITVMKRDAVKLAAYGQEETPCAAWLPLQEALFELHKHMRRSLSEENLNVLHKKVQQILNDVQSLLALKTKEMSGNDTNIERHHHSSKTDSYDSELIHENGEAADVGRHDEAAQHPSAEQEPPIPLPLVLKAAPDILPYASDSIRNWNDLIVVAHDVRGMMGISPDAWREAISSMGAANAAVTLVCILQRVSEIRSPGGYLRALTRKAQNAAFSPGPMVMALLSGEGRA